MKSYQVSDNDATSQLAESNTDHIKCDICMEQKAVCYCTNCEQKLCDEHFKLHEQSTVFFPTKHHQIDISKYNTTPGRYQPKYCPSHEDKKLISACYSCRKLFCTACEAEKASCKNDHNKSNIGQGHDTVPLPTMAARMRHELNTKLKDIADKITEGINLEKTTWEGLHQIESEVPILMTEIDRVVEEKILSMRERGEKLKEELKCYQKRCTEKVENLSGQLRDKRDTLESLWKSIMDELRQTHDAEIITGYRAKEAKLLTARCMDYEPIPDLPHIQMAGSSPDNDVTSLGISLMELDSLCLQFKTSVVKSNVICYAVTWFGDELVVGADNGVLVCNTITGEEKCIAVGSVVHSVKSTGSFAVATLCNKSGQDREVRISNVRLLSNQESIFCQLGQNNNILAHLSVSERHVAVVDKQSKQVVVFNRKGEQVYYIGSGQLQDPGGILLHENHIFVCDLKDNCCYKFKLEAPSEPVWVCKDLPDISGICKDKDGCLYVVSFSGKQIHLVSPKGVRLTTLMCDELSKTSTVHDISLSDDGSTLALACRKEGVKLFTIAKSKN